MDGREARDVDEDGEEEALCCVSLRLIDCDTVLCSEHYRVHALPLSLSLSHLIKLCNGKDVCVMLWHSECAQHIARRREADVGGAEQDGDEHGYCAMRHDQ